MVFYFHSTFIQRSVEVESKHTTTIEGVTTGAPHHLGALMVPAVDQSTAVQVVQSTAVLWAIVTVIVTAIVTATEIAND